MALKCGIVGLPNVGKSTLFNALAGGGATAANFPFCTIEPNVGVVPVPDPRLQQLNDLVQPERLLPAHMEFVDIAGLVKGASQGEGLGNQFLANIREVDAILHVVRCFDDDKVVHVAGSVSPVFDLEVIEYELQQKDLASLAKRKAKTEKIAKTGDKEAKKTWELITCLEKDLTAGKNARDLTLTDSQAQEMLSWQLLTSKPVIYVANVDEATLTETGVNTHVQQLKEHVGHAPVLVLCAALEAQLVTLPAEEKAFFLDSYNLSQTSLDELIQAAYQLLQQITYFTAGPQEVRAWTILKGTQAPQAAGVIHTDFEKGFIKAEVIKLTDYLVCKTEVACREAGKIHIEGKAYVVEDGDVMHFRFNV